MTGLIVVFSGLDGAGKSTQIELLQHWLRSHKIEPVYLWTRGGYSSGMQSAKDWLRRSRANPLPPPGPGSRRQQAFQRSWLRRAWLSLAILDLLRVHALQVRFWRLRGRVVICDRYLPDTWIDFHLNFPQEQVERWLLWKLLLRLAPQPDLAYLFLVPVEESLSRSDRKGEPFRDPPNKLRERLAWYERIARQQPWRVIDGLLPVADLHQLIRQDLHSRLGDHAL